MPCLTIVWVCPPQTSIIVQGRVVIRRISRTSAFARPASRYSSTYFTSVASADRAGPRSTTAGAAIPGPIVASSCWTRSPIWSNSSSVRSASSSSTMLIAKPTWMIT